MAIYDIGADAATAVAAFLNQFTLNANGDIRHGSGSDAFHIWWLHRALQTKVYDFTVSGDDLLNLPKPNPSTSEALGTIITLLDHTTDYGVNYNITDADAQYLFGGSVSQDGGDKIFGGLGVLGAVASLTALQIIQNNALLTSHWGTGKNQTDNSTLLRILIPYRVGGSDIDGGRIVVKANEFGDTYAVWRTTLGLGEKVASITTTSDPQNNTAESTVAAYTGISTTEGYQLIDVGTGGAKPYLTGWDYGANSKKALYEYRKWQLRAGTAETIFGIDGDLFTGGPTFRADVSGSGSELLVQNEVLTWTEGGQASSGVLMGADDLEDGSASEIWIHILTGVNPTDTTVLSGAAGSVALTADAVNLQPNPNGIGQFTGSAWIGDYGIGFNSNQVTQADSFSPLDNSGPISPPDNVPISVTVNGIANSRVYLARATSGVIDQAEYTAAAGNDSGNATFAINEAIKSDSPGPGTILVIEGGAIVPIVYTSFAGSTFTLVGTLPQSFTSGATVWVPMLYDEIASDGGSASTSIVRNGDVEVAGWVRYGNASSPRKPVPISGTIGAAGLALTVTLEAE